MKRKLSLSLSLSLSFSRWNKISTKRKYETITWLTDSRNRGNYGIFNGNIEGRRDSCAGYRFRACSRNSGSQREFSRALGFARHSSSRFSVKKRNPASVLLSRSFEYTPTHTREFARYKATPRPFALLIRDAPRWKRIAPSGGESGWKNGFSLARKPRIWRTSTVRQMTDIKRNRIITCLQWNG